METTYRALGSLLLGLLSDPAQLDAVRADRSLLPQVIEEGCDGNRPADHHPGGHPRHRTWRRADSGRGDGDANAGFGEPPRGPLGRSGHVQHPPTGQGESGLGHGVHVCLGMHLARLEMRTAINLLLDRLPNLRLDPDGDDPHIRGQVFRSPTSVPVLFDAQR